MNEAEIHEIAKQAAREAVKETLIALGIDPDKPIEAQKDMQFLRGWREATNTVKKQGIVTAVGVIVAGMIGVIWLAVKGPVN